MASAKLNEKLVCPNCKKELDYLEELAFDKSERKTAWTCYDCDIIVYVVEFYETN